jgi:hypothetical protein
MTAGERLEVGGVIVNDASNYRVDSMPYGGVRTAAPAVRASATPSRR